MIYLLTLHRQTNNHNSIFYIMSKVDKALDTIPEDSFLIGSQCNAQRTTDSFHPVSVDKILADIKNGQYRNLVDQARRYRYEGNLEGAHAVEGSLRP